MEKIERFLNKSTAVIAIILIVICTITFFFITNDLINCLVKYKLVKLNNFGTKLMFEIFNFYISLLFTFISFDFLIKLTEKYVYSKD